MEKTIETCKLLFSLIGGFISGMLGGVDKLLQFYVILFVCDLIFGALKGIKTKKFSSSILFWGFMNKMIAVAVIAILTSLDGVIGFNDTLRNIAIIWFCICEGASILENLAMLGLPIPDGLRSILVQVKKGFNINITKIVKQIIDNYNIPIEDIEEEEEKQNE